MKIQVRVWDGTVKGHLEAISESTVIIGSQVTLKQILVMSVAQGALELFKAIKTVICDINESKVRTIWPLSDIYNAQKHGNIINLVIRKNHNIEMANGIGISVHFEKWLNNTVVILLCPGDPLNEITKLLNLDVSNFQYAMFNRAADELQPDKRIMDFQTDELELLTDILLCKSEKKRDDVIIINVNSEKRECPAVPGLFIRDIPFLIGLDDPYNWNVVDKDNNELIEFTELVDIMKQGYHNLYCVRDL